MRFVILHRAEETFAERNRVAMNRYHEALAKAGVLLVGEALGSVTGEPSASVGAPVVGFTLLEVRSREEALAWASRWPADVGGGVELEVRAVVG